MPRHQKTMKDVAACEKSRLGGKQPANRESPNGVTRPDGRSGHHALNQIGALKTTWRSETSQ